MGQSRTAEFAVPPPVSAIRPRSSGGDAGSARRGVRPEIQALRTIAVGAVVWYHLSPPSLPGGYVGVDVFFVISGFLISSHLLREADRTGRVSLAAFWAGRARRILPAALVTGAVVVVAATLLLPRTTSASVGQTAVWAALSAANWLFAGQSVDYQAQSPDASPLEHFWSLGVEEQFYLLWPLLVLAAVLLTRHRVRARRRVVVLLFSFVFAASLAFGVAFTFGGSPAAYFITPTRMWELAAGGLLAATLGNRQPSRAVAAVLQLGGLAAIAVGCAVFTAATLMPGVAAALPVFGAVAFIAGGDVPVLRRVWAFRPVQAVGDRSYSLYLWHWPLIVFTRLLAPGATGPLLPVALVAGSLVLASLSYSFVEQPIRRRRLVRPLRAIAFGLAAIVGAVALAGLPTVTGDASAAAEAAARGALLHTSASAAAPALGYPQLVPAADRTWAREPHVLVPDPSQVGNDLPPGGCFIDQFSRTEKMCVQGDTASSTTIALVGDSHAVQWLGAMDALAKQHHWRLLSLSHNSCPFNTTKRLLEQQGHSTCQAAIAAAIPVLVEQHVKVLITSSLRTSYQGEYPAGTAGFASTWRQLQSKGIRVIALGDTPTPPALPLLRDCAAGAQPQDCGMTRASAESPVDPQRAAAAEAGVPYIDPVSAFCGTAWCQAVIGNVIVYRDANHVSNTYFLSALPWVEQHLAPVVTRLLR